MRSQVLLGAALPLVSAHFQLVYPAVRGFNEDSLSTFPCGGQNTVSENRTSWPISGGPIQLDMGHTASQVQVLLALGNDPGSNFNITLVPTFREEGPENFCIAGSAIQIPEAVRSMITEGMNATIQVVTNGDPAGGLYNCADITFTQASLSTEEYNANCRNSTGVTATYASGLGNANGSTTTGASTSSSVAAAASSSVRAATSTGGASLPTMASYALGAMGVFAGVLAL